MEIINKSIKTIRKVVLTIWVLLLANVLALSLFSFHILSFTSFGDIKDSYRSINEVIRAKRGTIYDRNSEVLAEDTEAYSIYCMIKPLNNGLSDENNYIKDKEYTAEVLSPILGIDKKTIISYLSSEGVYQVELGAKGRNLSVSKRDEILAKNLPGIGFMVTNSRFYPSNSLAAHTIGYVAYESNQMGVGMLGIEKYYEKELAGYNGRKVSQQDVGGYSIAGTEKVITAAKNGNNIYLTIDRGIQDTLERALTNISKGVKSNEAWGGVMEVKTGKILAWAQYPSFNQNDLNIKNFNNIGIELPYEVGSTMKSFTYAAALENNPNFNMNLTFNSAPFIIDNRSDYDKIIRGKNRANSVATIYNINKQNYGTINFTEGFGHSANTAIATLFEKYISPKDFEAYMEKFGFFQKVNTDRFEDASGEKVFERATEIITSGYGQGSTMTMLQLFQGYSGLLNDGKMVKPYFVEKITDSTTGKTIYQAQTNVIANVISPKTSKEIIKAMKYNVDVSYGNAKLYRLDNVKIIAKTGTSEVVETGGYGRKTIMSMMIGLPFDNPKVICYYAVRVDSGISIHKYAKEFKAVLQKTINNLGLRDNMIDPTSTDTPEKITNQDSYGSTLPSLTNHSVDYASKRLTELKATTVIIGNGKSVIAQLPIANTKITHKQKVFILTSVNDVKMPNMSNWTRTEINSFFSLLDYFRVNIIGNGLVYEQSLAHGELINKENEITLKLK